MRIALIIARQRVGKHVSPAKKNRWRRRFLCGPCRIKGESVGLSVYPSIVARQRLGKHVSRKKRIVGGVVFYVVRVVSK
jgi:hypothetical protein